ncbi:MAG: T9SS type A sorting domain-containing protein [Bacteroidota bacterium]
MKKSLFILCILGLAFNALAQITITGTDMPQAGSYFTLSNDTMPSVSLGAPDPNSQVWDFNSLVNSYYKFAVYSLTSETPYAGTFTASNIHTYGPAAFFSSLYGGAPVDSGNNGYSFWSSDSTGLKVIGWVADEGPYSGKNVFVNPTELLIGAPATYGTIFNNYSQWEFGLNDNPIDIDTFYISRRTKTLTCDAWGELITPYDTFNNVLRYHEYVIQEDSVRLALVGIWDSIFEYYRDTSNNYMYLINGMGYPVAIVHADVNNNIKDVEYLTDSLYIPPGIATPFKPQENIHVYPNPISNNTILTIDNIPTGNFVSSFVLYDLPGREIIRVDGIRERKFIFTIPDINCGIYIYKVLNDRKVIGAGKIIINK